MFCYVEPDLQYGGNVFQGVGLKAGAFDKIVLAELNWAV